MTTTRQITGTPDFQFSGRLSNGCFTAVLMFLILIAGCSDSSESAPKSGERSVDFVRIRLSDKEQKESLQFEIPRVYLVQNKPRVDSTRFAIRFRSQLPHLGAVQKLPKVPLEARSPAYDRARSEINNTFVVWLEAKYVRYRNGNARYSRVVTGDPIKYQAMGATESGLERFKRLRCKKPAGAQARETCDFAGSEVFFTPQPNRLLIQCSHAALETSGCRIKTHFHDRSLEIIIRKSEIHRWQEFLDGAIWLLNKFLISDLSSEDEKLGRETREGFKGRPR